MRVLSRSVLNPEIRSPVPYWREFVNDWKFAQKSPNEELSQVHKFTFKKCQGAGNTEFVITVREFAAPPPGQHVHFFAQADKQVNQKLAPFVPSGWGNSLLEALTGCTRMIREFPCEEEASSLNAGAPPAAPAFDGTGEGR
jgi:hypothetical protein